GAPLPRAWARLQAGGRSAGDQYPHRPQPYPQHLRQAQGPECGRRGEPRHQGGADLSSDPYRRNGIFMPWPPPADTCDTSDANVQRSVAAPSPCRTPDPISEYDDDARQALDRYAPPGPPAPGSA